MSVDLSIIILCYRAGERIVSFSERVKNEIDKHTNNYEIILVGNYDKDSQDDTIKYINAIVASDSHFRSISETKEGMMGWDVKKGLSAGTGTYLCFVDGDGQFPIESISQCYLQIQNGEYDLVKTYRVTRNDGIQRRVISCMYNLIFRIMFPLVKSKDINSKPKIMKRALYEQLHLTYDDWFIDAEIMIKASRLKAKQYEFPIEFLELKGRSSLVNNNTVWEFIRNLIVFRFTGK